MIGHREANKSFFASRCEPSLADQKKAQNQMMLDRLHVKYVRLDGWQKVHLGIRRCATKREVLYNRHDVAQSRDFAFP